MPWKALTSAVEMAERYGTVEMMMTRNLVTLQQSYEYWKEKGIVHIDYRMKEFVNVQRLMTLMNMVDSMKVLPFIKPAETLPIIIRAGLLTLEEEEYFTKRYIKKEVLEAEEMRRPEEVRIEKRLEEVRKRLLHTTAINFTDFEEFCLMEKYLWTTLRDEVNAVLDKIIMMTIAKQRWCERIPELEALQKLMLQLYVTMFMGHPEQVNMIALRISALTRQRLYGVPMSIYMTASHQAQAMKPKALLMTVQKRKLETKYIASGKTRYEYVPRKEAFDTCEEYSDEMKIQMMRDLKGKAMFSIAMRFAYGMPYFLRRWLARTYGFPENYHLIRYLKMMGIPIRLATWAWKRRRYTGDSWTYFQRDEYLKLQKKYGSRYGEGRPYRYRYWRGRRYY